ncbi:hypothetical protein CN575_21450 [Bacillus wiedmannii]|uniref:hypothetical protein n=1 Tax=Bacillus TaxID=1386 RepID=UPI000BF3B63E|nr:MULTISPECIES: hypothetical protein [Bacillus]PEP31663.1 hypothetical protein CN575_21450 [Bacillus wiedmannii]PHF26649.1 hypothetical protein COF82_24175 [Bacillus wiedmannii]
MNDKLYSGIVENGLFNIVQKKPVDCNQVRLTKIPMQAAQTPESAQIELSNYEGKNIQVSGRLSGCWIFSAEVK